MVKVLLRLLGISDGVRYLFTPAFYDMLIGCDAALTDKLCAWLLREAGVVKVLRCFGSKS